MLILRQQQHELIDEIKVLYESHCGKSTRPSLKEMSQLLTGAIAEFVNAFIIVDALDDCPEQGRVRQAFLDELRFPRLSVNFIGTSRPIERLKHDIQADATLEIGASNTDIERYLEGRRNQDRRLSRLVGADVSLEELVTKTLIANANGMYVFDHLLSYELNHLFSFSKL